MEHAARTQHDINEKLHHESREKELAAKVVRQERHSGSGHDLKEGPKKGGAGAGNWGRCVLTVTSQCMPPTGRGLV